MPFRHARARLPDCISIIGQIRRNLHARHHNEIWELPKCSQDTALRDIATLVERGISLSKLHAIAAASFTD